MFQTSLLLDVNDFKTKSKLKWIFLSQENTKLLTESHDKIETTYMSESSIFFITRNRIFDFKIMLYFMKKINTWAMWLIFVVPTCNYLFDFFDILTLKIFNSHAVYVGFHLPDTIKNYYITPFYICIYISFVHLP